MKQQEETNETQTVKNHILGKQFPSEPHTPTPANSRSSIRIQTLTLPMSDNTETSLLYAFCDPSGFASFCYKATKANLMKGEGRTQTKQMQTHPPCTHRQLKAWQPI